MISLYPSHIHISFPYPYISHIYKSFIIFACCPATCFFIFHFSFFCGVERGVFFLWFFGVGIVDGFRSVFRPVSRFVLRFVLPVSFFAPFFGLSCVSFVRLGVSWGGSFGTGRCLGRGGWLVVWRGEMAGRSGCAPFLSARVRRRWRWSLVFRSTRLASRLFCSFRRGGRCVACLASVGRGGCGCDVASSRFSSRVGVPCRRVSSCRLVFSRRCHSRRCRRSFSCSSRRVCRVAACLASGCWSVSTWRCVVAGCGLCGVAWRRGVAWIVPLAVR